MSDMLAYLEQNGAKEYGNYINGKWVPGHGGKSYETVDYKLNMKDPGHWYELTLKRPAAGFMLLYEVGDQWKIVDISKKGVDQN